MSYRESGILGDYRLQKLLEYDGLYQSNSYRAEHLPSGRAVRVKVIDPRASGILAGYGPGLLTRAAAALQRLAALEHPHLLSVVDYVATGDMVYFAEPDLPGGTLADRLRAG